jgi:transposase-like protein
MMTLTQMADRFPTDDACYEYLVALRWPEGASCPSCGSPKVYRLKGGKGRRWVCKAPAHGGKNYNFSALVGTIFENTNIKLRTWFATILLMCQSKKGISALQIQRTLGLGSYRSAWYMCHRIRAAMESTDFTKLMGQVEVDETYVGGRYENRHRADRKARDRKRSGMAVFAAIARKGKVVARVIEHADIPTLDGFVKEVVSDKVSLVASDEHWGYSKLAAAGYRHETVKHRDSEYARGIVHTANLDSFWAMLKRGIVGSYHQVSRKYLPFYLAEFTFRHNNRKHPDLFAAVVAAC